jgi:hypothetical protein
MSKFKEFMKFLGLAFVNVLTHLFGTPEDQKYIAEYTQRLAVGA